MNAADGFLDRAQEAGKLADARTFRLRPFHESAHRHGQVDELQRLQHNVLRHDRRARREVK